MTSHPHLVVEYILFDDHRLFEPLQLYCAVEDLVQTESTHGKLNIIVRYWLRCKKDGRQVILSFGLGG